MTPLNFNLSNCQLQHRTEYCSEKNQRKCISPTTTFPTDSTEILAFEQLKFWLRTEQQIFTREWNLPYNPITSNTLDLFACLVKGAPMSIICSHAQLFMPAFNLAWTLYIQLRRCCLHNFQRNAVKVSATAVREGQTLTVGAASNNIIPQVDALFSSLSDIRPAKIPPERRHRRVRKTLCACFTQKTSVILNETQPGLNQYDKNFNVQVILSSTEQETDNVIFT